MGKRYNAVVPDRADNKHRLYSKTDIEKIAHLSLEELKEIHFSLTNKSYNDKSILTPTLTTTEIESILNSFLLALAAYKIDIISHELQKAQQILGPRTLCLEIIVPLFQEIGKRVHSGEISIAQEHTLSALVRFYMGQMIGTHYQKSLLKEDLILITTPEGELHEIGILAASLLCVEYGMKFIYLGTNLPAQSLAEAANALNPKIILIGSTRFELDHNRTMDDYLKTLRENLKVSPTLWVGGNIKPYLKSELEKKKIQFFSNLDALDKHLSSF